MKHLVFLSYICLCTFGLAGKDPNPQLKYATINIAGIGFEQLTLIKDEPGVLWWVELDQTLLVLTQKSYARDLAQHAPIKLLAVKADPSALVYVSKGHGVTADHQDGYLLASGGRFAVMQLFPGQSAQALFEKPDEDPDHSCHGTWMPFLPNQVLARSEANQEYSRASKFRSEVQTLVDAVDGERWLQDVTSLSEFSRVTGSEGVDQAAFWLIDAFSKLPGISVKTQDFSVGSTMATNVIATLPGINNPQDIYIIGAHYDSIASRDGGAIAPGAEDNGSGTAAVLEMARIFSAFRPHGTYVFICYSGEEQGLNGSYAHLEQIQSQDLASSVKAVCVMDMIGYSSDPDLDVLLESGREGIPTLAIWATAAADYTNLRVVTSTNYFGSDHVPYINADMAALLTIENEYGSYPGYHRSTDTAEKIVTEMGQSVIRMNVAALAGMSGFQGFDTPIWVANP